MAEQVVELQPSESQVVTFEATPSEAKTYQVIVDGLSGSFRAMAVPNISLESLTWDATPPFYTNSRHVWTVKMKNLSTARLTYQLEMYMNGENIISYTANLAAGEVREKSWSYYFGAGGSYTLTAKAYYEGELLDEISSTVTVKVPPPPKIIDGRLLSAHALWEGLPNWIVIGYSNTWPANAAILTSWEVKNTGNVRATFRVMFMGRSGSIALNPGEAEHIQFTVNTGSPGSHSYTMNIYGDSKLVESASLEVTTY